MIWAVYVWLHKQHEPKAPAEIAAALGWSVADVRLALGQLHQYRLVVDLDGVWVAMEVSDGE